jgi:hypothetical protein
MFRTRETRLAQGALFTPGTAVSTATGDLPAARLPHRNGTPLASRTATRPGKELLRGISKGSPSFTPHQPSPRLQPRTERDPRAFPWASHPAGQDPAAHARAGTGTDTARTTSLT